MHKELRCNCGATLTTEHIVGYMTGAECGRPRGAKGSDTWGIVYHCNSGCPSGTPTREVDVEDWWDNYDFSWVPSDLKVRLVGHVEIEDEWGNFMFILPQSKATPEGLEEILSQLEDD